MLVVVTCVTIRSLPLDHTPNLPEFDFVQPDIEGTIRKLSNYIRSVKEAGVRVR